jgi:hypothetical protein
MTGRRIPPRVPPAPTGPVPNAPPPTPEVREPIDGDGIARGCRDPDSVRIEVAGVDIAELLDEPGLGGLIPSWVQATPTPRSRPSAAPRVVEGRLDDSYIATSDWPLKPWHTNYDWDMYLRVDPQYGDLLSVANDQGILECEWDSEYLPSWAWPQRGQRVWIMGRWIYDCGHPNEEGDCRTEIHPPRAIASFRSEAVQFSGNPGPVRATTAVLYIGRRGGYWTSPINDRDYEFTLPLPAKPSSSAVPRVKVSSMTGSLPVSPQVTLSSTSPPIMNVKIPLTGLTPHPTEYGAIISCGWTDPAGTESRKIIPVNVRVEKIFMDANLDPLGADEWYVFVCINGRWRKYEGIGGDTETLNHSVKLDLHPLDRITISVCGFEADTLHDLMGKSTDIPPDRVSAKTTDSQATAVARTIRDKFLAASITGLNQNDEFTRMFEQESPTTRGTFRRISDDQAYRLQYTISGR